MVTTVYFIRHGESMGNTEGYFQGRSDCDLSRNGLLQLETLKERFKNISFDAIYSSPLKRTLLTAQAVSFYSKLPVQIDDGLIEIDGGIFEGLSFKEIPSRYPNEFDIFCNRLHMFAPEKGESVVQVYERMISAVDRLVRENATKTIVLVSHGCAIKNYLCFATGTPLERISELSWSDNTSVSKVNFDDSFTPAVEFMNDASHLEGLDLEKPEFHLK